MRLTAFEKKNEKNANGPQKKSQSGKATKKKCKREN